MNPNRYRQSVGQVENVPPSKPATDCMADNCPLPGVYRLTNETSVCRAHDNIPAKDWPRVTERVISNEKALHAAIHLCNAVSQSDPDPRIVAAFVKHFGPTFERRSKNYGLSGQSVKVRDVGPETARDYGQRVYLLLLDNIRGDASRNAPVDLAAVIGETWKPIGVAV